MNIIATPIPPKDSGRLPVVVAVLIELLIWAVIVWLPILVVRGCVGQ